MSKTKRIVALVFALIVLLATVMGTFAGLAFGAFVPDLGDGHSLTVPDLQLKLESTTPTGFTKGGTYTFTLKGVTDITLEGKDPDGGTFSISNAVIDNTTVSFNGITVTSESGLPFVGGDKFSLEFGSGSVNNVEQIKEGNIDVRELSSNLDGDFFRNIGTYRFEITADGKVKFDGALMSDSTVSGNKATFKGAQVTKAGGSFREGDEFSIIIGEYAGNNRNGTPIIQNRKITRVNSSSEVSSIRKNTRVNIKLEIVDTNVENKNYIDGLEGVSLSSGAFKTDSSSISSISHIGSQDGMAKFEVVFENVIYTGKGNSVSFRMWYETGSENVSYDLSVTFSEYNFVETPTSSTPDTDDDDEELAPLTPHIIVNGYDYGGKSVVAGQTIKLNITFKNTSPDFALENIVMKLATPEALSIASSSNTYYIDKLAKNGTMNQTVEIMVKPSATPESHSLDIDFSFQYVANDKRNSATSKESIAIPVTQVDRFEINNIDTPGKIYVGDEYPISVSMINKGKSPVYNVAVSMNGNMKNAGQSEFLGNIESGKENSADFFIGSNEAGEIDGEIVITYEDANMNIKTITRPLNVVVEGFNFEPPPGDFDPGLDVGPIEPETETPSHTKTALIICGIIIAALQAYTTIMKIKAKRSEFADEDI